MAKKARKKSVVKAKKRKRATTPARVKAKSRTKTVTKTKKAVRRPRPKPQPEGVADKVASAFHTVVDTIKETGTLRNKLGPRGSEP